LPLARGLKWPKFIVEIRPRLTLYTIKFTRVVSLHLSCFPRAFTHQSAPSESQLSAQPILHRNYTLSCKIHGLFPHQISKDPIFLDENGRRPPRQHRILHQKIVLTGVIQNSHDESGPFADPPIATIMEVLNLFTVLIAPDSLEFV